ncbi:hypothetical protein CSKR_200337 [Clonorchis sinensis]|uniref:Uncharacterized protein n=1 Tax=Clonorchis sinensis TaxID=79923 RepID=A0A8T1MCS3_CLOSI|nr:hypothetical protein CSKR_200337 [Clonorchis sinensis]
MCAINGRKSFEQLDGLMEAYVPIRDLCGTLDVLRNPSRETNSTALVFNNSSESLMPQSQLALNTNTVVNIIINIIHVTILHITIGTGVDSGEDSENNGVGGVINKFVTRLRLCHRISNLVHPSEPSTLNGLNSPQKQYAN